MHRSEGRGRWQTKTGMWSAFVLVATACGCMGADEKSEPAGEATQSLKEDRGANGESGRSDDDAKAEEEMAAAPAPADAADADTEGGREIRGLPSKPAPKGKYGVQGPAAGAADPGLGMGSGNGWIGGAPPPPAELSKKMDESGADRQGTLDDAVANVAIDPNGRFATTYRPGGGHLSAFESAVARGVIPQDAREIVSDVGARYESDLPRPDDEALSVQAEFERAVLPPGGGEVHMRVAIKSTEEAAKARPKLAVSLVLDTSGSMRGDAIEQARAAAAAVVDKLAPTDSFSLVTFSSNAEVEIPHGTVGPRRDQLKRDISEIEVGGGTNISEGLRLAYAEAEKQAAPDDAVKVVLLLSDGRANAGITDPVRVSGLALEAFQDGVQTSSFGLGTNYDGALMSAIASDGAGGYYYLRDPEQIAPALSTELEQRLDPVATAVELRVRLHRDVNLLKVYGSRRLSSEEANRVRAQEVAADQQAAQRDGIETDREEDVEGGMRFFMPAFARSDSHSILLKLDVPAGVHALSVADIELKYKDRVAGENFADELPITVEYASSDADSAASLDLDVAKTVQAFAAGETLSSAASQIAYGNRQAAAVLLAEREGILRHAADMLDEPLFLRDADRLARLRSHAEGDQDGLGDPLLLAMVMETCGRVHMR